ncbi:unnamed protein product [Thelazia callipaeda]|uniref:Cap n=1 Tax=Thelazia callipaeda TaxID=103827 RepID=A0A0N5D8T7_THECL|nr:unnamed protein product [Thelazia callipaeda]
MKIMRFNGRMLTDVSLFALRSFLSLPLASVGTITTNNSSNSSTDSSMLVPLSFLLCIEIGLGNELSSRENKDKILSQLYQFLYKRLKEQAKYEVASDKKGVKPVPYKIPGPFEPLPGRSHITNFWPLFPFSNQYSGGVDLDPSTTRHFGGDLNVPVPSWGMMDINGRFYNRIQDTTYKFGYHLAPVNMLGLKKNDLDDLMTDPFLLVNRANQPLIPIATVPKTFVPMSCKAPLCNPFTQNFAFGVSLLLYNSYTFLSEKSDFFILLAPYEQDIGGWNGVESDIDIPIPISKYLAYNFPLSGNFYIRFHEPMPGRNAYDNYWPIFPFSNQFQLGLDVDPAQSRHAGGDIYVPVPTWGIWDFSGRAFYRIQDYNALIGYHSSPVNMLGLTKDDFLQLLTDQSMHINQNNQPLIPVANLPRSFVPMSCRPPMCNPYTQNFGLGIVYDWGFGNGLDGELDLPVPISKNLAYRLPVSGNIYYHPDNLTITYGHNLAPIDPFQTLFEFEKTAPNDYLVDNRGTQNVRSKRDLLKLVSFRSTFLLQYILQRNFQLIAVSEFYVFVTYISSRKMKYKFAEILKSLEISWSHFPLNSRKLSFRMPRRKQLKIEDNMEAVIFGLKLSTASYYQLLLAKFYMLHANSLVEGSTFCKKLIKLKILNRVQAITS